MIDKSSKVLIITSCCKEKRDIQMKACDLYQGTVFKKVKKFVKHMGFSFQILSAKYGLINSNELIEPYDIKITNKEDIFKLRLKIQNRMNSNLDHYDLILIIMGKNYREVIFPYFESEKIIILNDTRGIGGLTQFINFLNRINRENLLKVINKAILSEKKTLSINDFKNLQQKLF